MAPHAAARSGSFPFLRPRCDVMTAPISSHGPGAVPLRPSVAPSLGSGQQAALPLSRDPTQFSTTGALLAQLDVGSAHTRDVTTPIPGAVPMRPPSTGTAVYSGQQAALPLSTPHDSARFSAASVLLAQLDADSGSIQDIAMLLAQPPSSSQDAVARLSVLLSRRLGVLLQQEGLATAHPLGFHSSPQGRVLVDPATHPEAARVQALFDSHPDLQALARYLLQAGPIQLQTMALGREASRPLDLTPPIADASRVPWPLLGWLQPRQHGERSTRRWPAWAIALLAMAAVLAGLALL